MDKAYAGNSVMQGELEGTVKRHQDKDLLGIGSVGVDGETAGATGRSRQRHGTDRRESFTGAARKLIVSEAGFMRKSKAYSRHWTAPYRAWSGAC
jgi:hypothetical protein